MKFRIKGTTEVLVPRMTDEGCIVLLPEHEKPTYIDDYFHDNRPVPDLEVSADGVVWWMIIDPDEGMSPLHVIKP